METNSILELFEHTFDDRILDPEERKELTLILNEANLPNQDINYIRNNLFKFARYKSDSKQAIQIVAWLEKAIKILLKYHRPDSEFNEVHFNPEGDCCQVILRNLQKTQNDLKICVYTISDNRLAKEILNRYRQKVQVRIITDDERIWDPGSDIRQLAKKGIEIKVDDKKQLMHHKFAVLDQKRLITGSYNWTSTAAQFNFENLLVTNQISVVHAYNQEFEKLWDKLEPLKVS